MMAKALNGSTKWIVALLVTLGLAALGAMNAAGIFQGEIKSKVENNCNEIVDIKEGIKEYIIPELIKNSDHRKIDEVDTPYIRRDIKAIEEKVANIEVVQKQILTEVQKR